MQHVSIARVGEEIKRRLGDMPRKRYLIAATVLVGLMVIGELLGGPEALRDLCRQIVSDLGQIQPIGMIGRYFDNLAGCDTTVGYGGDYLNCSPWRFIDPRRFLGSLIMTVGDVWSASGVPGKIILPFALIVSFPVAWAVTWGPVRKLFGETTTYFVSLCLASVLTPFLASLVALVLQLLAIVMFTIFGATLGLIAWFGTIFGGVWSVWKVVNEIKESAEKMEHVAGAVASVVGVKKVATEEPDHQPGG